MKKESKEQRSPSCLSRVLFLFVGLILLVGMTFNFYRPDRPLPTIPQDSSSEPAFVVQVIRPREGLPLGGLLPPQLFGADADLGFDSTSSGARHRVGNRRIELNADDWELQLVFGGNGDITAETEIVFKLVFEDRVRTVRCRPGDPPIGTLKTNQLENPGELSGSFDIELPNCVDAETKTPLGWPPKPLILHGSFDRLPVGNRTE